MNNLENIAYLTVYFPDNVLAHVNVNWLSPVKMRTTLVGGQKRMLVWNDLDMAEKLRVYDKGADIKSESGCMLPWSVIGPEICTRQKLKRPKR